MPFQPPQKNYHQFSKGPIQQNGPAPMASASSGPGFQSKTDARIQNSPGVSGSPSMATQNMASARDFAKNYESTDANGNLALGTPKVYDSVGDAGSGFVNLSHLLALNKDSGAQSANAFARNVKNEGRGALSGISGLENQFNKDAIAGSSSMSGLDYFAPNMENAQGVVDKAKNAAYTGPNDLTSMGAYNDLAKKVSDAQNMAKNTQSGTGMAAEVNKETGLSPIQSAASAFYMGVNNPNVKRAGSPFTNLQAALDQANQRAMMGANSARYNAKDLNNKGIQWQSDLDKMNDPANQVVGDDVQAENQYNKLVGEANGNNATDADHQEWQDFGNWLKSQGGSDSGGLHGGVFGGSMNGATLENYKKWLKWKQAHK